MGSLLLKLIPQMGGWKTWLVVVGSGLLALNYLLDGDTVHFQEFLIIALGALGLGDKIDKIRKVMSEVDPEELKKLVDKLK